MKGGTIIPNNADMNNYTTPGNYYCISNSATRTLKNCPFTLAFTLKVEYSRGNSVPCQTFREYNTGITAYRKYESSTWIGYAYFSDDSLLFYGKRIQSGDDLNDYRTPGTYSSISSTVSTTLLNMPETISAGFSLLVLQFSTGTVIQVIFKGAMADAIYTRSITSSGWQPWYKYAGEKIEA